MQLTLSETDTFLINNFLLLSLLCAAAEGQMDCLLLLVNREQSADIIDSPDTQGQWVTEILILSFVVNDWLGKHLK